MKYAAFDLEIEKEIPEGERDWKKHRPLGITCAAVKTSDGDLWNWWANDRGLFTPKMTKHDCVLLVSALESLVRDGYTLLTWNGLSFDFDVLAEESGLYNECKTLALDHIDMMFHFFAEKGYRLSLDAAAKGQDLPGKPKGMDGAKAPLLWLAGEYHRVLYYVSTDVENTLGVAQAIDKAGRLNWTARSGNSNSWECDGWLTVDKANGLPRPDTSWMTDPATRKSFLEWTEPADASNLTAEK